MKKLIVSALLVAFVSFLGAQAIYAGGLKLPTPPAEKNPKLAALLSGLVPCTGQWYNGQLFTLKSAAMALCEGGSIFVLAFFAARDSAQGVAFAGMGGMIATHGWSAADAYLSAKTINKGLALEIDQEKQQALVSYNIPF